MGKFIYLFCSLKSIIFIYFNRFPLSIYFYELLLQTESSDARDFVNSPPYLQKIPHKSCTDFFSHIDLIA